MQSIREAQQETYKVIQDFVRDTNQAIKEVSEQHNKTEKAIKEYIEEGKKERRKMEIKWEKERKEREIEREKEKKEREIEWEKEREIEKEKERKEREIEWEKERKEREIEKEKEREKTEMELREERRKTEMERRETEKEMKKFSKQMGTLGNRFGELVEHMVFPAVVKHFNKLGYHFNFEFEGNCKVRDKNNQIIAEIDAYLENGTTIAVVEIKTKPDLPDIEKHIQRIEKLKQNLKEKNQPPKILIGAIAGGIFPKEVKESAIQAGFYVFVQSGNTMKLEIPKGFKPKEF
jgi:hypothetical protein